MHLLAEYAAKLHLDKNTILYQTTNVVFLVTDYCFLAVLNEQVYQMPKLQLCTANNGTRGNHKLTSYS